MAGLIGCQISKFCMMAHARFPQPQSDSHPCNIAQERYPRRKHPYAQTSDDAKEKRVLNVPEEESWVPLEDSGANILNRGILEEMASK